MSCLLFDFENLALRCFYGVPEIEPESETPNYDIWEYSVFNSIYWMLYKEKVSEVILALDDSSWRKIIYSVYKQNRKKGKEESKVDWDKFHQRKNGFLEELKHNLPIKIIKVNRAEADDIIGTLVLEGNLKDPIIVSMDKDYQQLLDKCKIYNPIKKEYVKKVDVEKFLLYSSICGQSKDNILNVKTPFDWPEWKKKPPMGEKTLEKIINNGELDLFLDTVIEYDFKNEETNEVYKTSIKPRDQYELNRKVMDMQCTPRTMKNVILNNYSQYKIYSNPDNLYSFFKNKGWNAVLDDYTRIESKLLELY